MKLMYKILLPTDFSKKSENVTDMAIKLAKKFDSEIILLHVLPPEADLDSIRNLLKLAVQNQFDKITAKMKEAGLAPPQTMLEFGSVFDEIIRIADYKDVNIIVMGAGKTTAESSHRLSTITGKVIRKTDKPVWVVKPGTKPRIKKILCPVDFSEPSARALEGAILMARRFEAEINIMTVFEPIDIYTEELDFVWEENDQLLHEFHERFEDFLKKFNLKKLKVTTTIKSGEPYAKILLTIDKYKPDLLVMGTTGKSGLSKILIGSVTEKVTREVPCSFVTSKSENMIVLNVESRIRDIEYHTKTGKQLLRDGYVDEAIGQFHVCLKLNSMHLPALYGLSEAYEIKGDEKKARMFRTLAADVLNRLWDSSLEKQIRRHYTV